MFWYIKMRQVTTTAVRFEGIPCYIIALQVGIFYLFTYTLLTSIFFSASHLCGKRFGEFFDRYQ